MLSILYHLTNPFNNESILTVHFSNMIFIFSNEIVIPHKLMFVLCNELMDLVSFSLAHAPILFYTLSDSR